ncbi:MAG: phosphoglycerate dehydrogenase [Coriobacteriales bacterium]|nr:phosphoglycerate dehydrogenase [Coriobacteriales bacterium]
MKVLIPEKFSKDGIKVLEDKGCKVDYIPDCNAQQLLDIVGECDGLIVRSATTVTEEVINAGKNLKVIGRAGVGVDNIDLEAATKQGVVVCNAPTSNVVSAAEQTMALILSLMRNTARADASMKAGQWNRSAFTGKELDGKTLAVFGLGRVGALVIDRAKAFGMKIAGYDPYCPPERAESMGVELYDNVNDLCKVADVITVHMPKTKETTNMFSNEQFEIMKDGVFCINVARGGIYDMDALARYIENGKVAGAAVDVWENEPVSTSPIHKFENVVLTPHLGASTSEAQTRAATQTAEYVLAGMQGKTVDTVVNSKAIPEEIMEELGPFVAASQKSGEMLAQLAKGNIDSIDICVYGKIAKMDTTVLGTALLAGVLSYSSEHRVNIINANYWAETRGVKVNMQQVVESQKYPSYVQFVTKSKNSSFALAVTVVPQSNKFRILEIDNKETDFVPSKHIAIFKYIDGPGRIGKIGTMLGDANISIESMQIASDKSAGDAIVLLNLSDAIDEDLFEDISSVVDATNSWQIEL